MNPIFAINNDLSQMSLASGPTSLRCGQCRNDLALGFGLSFAYQPIVDLVTRSIYAHEALPVPDRAHHR
jgi:EAL domain-containing protein (putative c-di-GMP-specific phosphodiesterase class I)